MGMVSGSFGEVAVSCPRSSLSGCNVLMNFMAVFPCFHGRHRGLRAHFFCKDDSRPVGRASWRWRRLASLTWRPVAGSGMGIAVEDGSEAPIETFQEALRSLGWIEGRDVEMNRRDGLRREKRHGQSKDT
jgi:hypothetical protein